MKPLQSKPIKPITRWVPVYPSGKLALQHLGTNRGTVMRGLTDSAEQWRELRAVGWRIVRVRISEIREEAGLEKLTSGLR
jgi:hypothetical protein